LDNKVKNSPFRKPIGVVSLCSHRGWSVHAPAQGGRTRRSLPSPSAREARGPALCGRPAPAGAAQRSCPQEEACARGPREGEMARPPSSRRRRPALAPARWGPRGPREERRARPAPAHGRCSSGGRTGGAGGLQPP